MIDEIAEYWRVWSRLPKSDLTEKGFFSFLRDNLFQQVLHLFQWLNILKVSKEVLCCYLLDRGLATAAVLGNGTATATYSKLQKGKY